MQRAPSRFGLSVTQHRVLRLMGGYLDGGTGEETIIVPTLRALHRRGLIESKNAVITFPSGEEPSIPLGSHWYEFQLTRDGSYLAATLGKWQEHGDS